MNNKNKDIQIIDEIINGNSDAFTLLVEKYKVKVFSLTMGMLLQKEDAEEVTMDVFIKVYRKLTTFKRNSSFATWLYRIGYNESVSKLRKRGKATVSLDNIPKNDNFDFANESDDYEQKEYQQKALMQAIGNLREEDRGLVWLYYFDGLPVGEIAGIVGLTSSNVKTKLFRIRKKLYNDLVFKKVVQLF